ncbi:MAG: HD domain-containing protein [Candidatus Nanohaloarchaeota archaeon QJJ-7]|nr:HD domain-containing protein [Candidatus Nanohaloarchaeota archaeon QJJ-7]
MDIDDPVHGSREIEEEILKELLDTSPVQRLKHVNQAGPSRYLNKNAVTRFDHSVGVMLLLREFDASLQEQIAGLLHDVPHTAFSHVADFVFDTERHEYHERFMDKIVRDSEIPSLLEDHGFDVDHILDDENFPLLERELPDLCADRIDYFLRDWKIVGGGDIQRMRESLGVHENRFVLSDRKVGEEYALKYVRADERWWANPEEVAVFHVLAEALRHALEKGLMEEDDLFGTDTEVLGLLQGFDEPEIEEKLELLDKGFEVAIDPENPDFVEETKLRYVDPLVVENGEEIRVTDYSEELQERIDEHREFLEGGFPIRIESPEI